MTDLRKDFFSSESVKNLTLYRPKSGNANFLLFGRGMVGKTSVVNTLRISLWDEEEVVKKTEEYDTITTESFEKTEVNDEVNFFDLWGFSDGQDTLIPVSSFSHILEGKVSMGSKREETITANENPQETQVIDCVFFTIDPQEWELEMKLLKEYYECAKSLEIPSYLLLTKIDLWYAKIEQNGEENKEGEKETDFSLQELYLSEEWKNLNQQIRSHLGNPSIFPFISVTKTSLDRVSIATIQSLSESFIENLTREIENLTKILVHPKVYQYTKVTPGISLKKPSFNIIENVDDGDDNDEEKKRKKMERKKFVENLTFFAQRHHTTVDVSDVNTPMTSEVRNMEKEMENMFPDLKRIAEESSGGQTSPIDSPTYPSMEEFQKIFPKINSKFSNVPTPTPSSTITLEDLEKLFPDFAKKSFESEVQEIRKKRKVTLGKIDDQNIIEMSKEERTKHLQESRLYYEGNIYQLFNVVQRKALLETLLNDETLNETSTNDLFSSKNEDYNNDLFEMNLE